MYSCSAILAIAFDPELPSIVNSIPDYQVLSTWRIPSARAYAFSELAACGGSQQEKKSFCEDTSRSGKGLPPSALLRSRRTHKPYCLSQQEKVSPSQTL